MDGYTDEQLRRAAAFGGHLCPGVTVSLAEERASGRVSSQRRLQVSCPIIRTEDDSVLVVLPDGTDRWIQRGR